MEKRRVSSTSQSSATSQDLVLREGPRVRLVFRPEIVTNPGSPEASVKGTFLYQKKRAADSWQDVRKVSLQKLSAGEGFQLSLSSGESLELYKELTTLYKLHDDVGVPVGEHEFVAVDSAVAQLATLQPEELRTYLSANEELGSSLLAELLAWAAQGADPAILVSRLIGLGSEDLRSLNAAIGLQGLKQALSLWEDGENRADEEFWQQTFAEHSNILEHVFSWPVTVVKGKAYVGGKSILNAGGNVVDFLVENQVTHNAAILEIKTPDTSLLRSTPYRGGIHNVSVELSGSVMQVSSYRHTLEREFDSLGTADLLCFSPKCVVLIGDTGELDDEDKKRSFDLFRAGLSHVDVVTFDEMFAKTSRLIELLETNTGSGNATNLEGDHG